MSGNCAANFKASIAAIILVSGYNFAWLKINYFLAIQWAFHSNY